jgi:hypothetical protein
MEHITRLVSGKFVELKVMSEILGWHLNILNVERMMGTAIVNELHWLAFAYVASIDVTGLTEPGAKEQCLNVRVGSQADVPTSPAQRLLCLGEFNWSVQHLLIL